MGSFHCRRCGNCCQQAGFVYLVPEDVERLSRHLQCDRYVFTEKYCFLQDRRHLVLGKTPDEACFFLENGTCAVYEARPRQCREFPLGWKTERSLDYCEGLKTQGI